MSPAKKRNGTDVCGKGMAMICLEREWRCSEVRRGDKESKGVAKIRQKPRGKGIA